MPDVFASATARGEGRTFAAGTFVYGWSTKTVLPIARGLHHGPGADLNGVIYLAGGYTGSAGTNRVDSWDTNTSTWTQKANLPGARYYGATVVCNGKVYVLGGLTSSTGYTSTTYEYDPATNTWTTRAAMPRTRHQHVAAVVNNKIYVMGGYESGTTASTTVDVYDPATNTWATKSAAFPTPRLYASAIDGGDGYIYVGGGYSISGSTGSALMHRYDPVADTFTARTSLPAVRYGMGFARRGTLIYSAGGFTTGYSNSLLAYDIVANTWTTKTNMGTARYLLHVASAPGGLYAMGGNNGGYLTTNEYFRVPEVEGQATAIGRGVTIPYPIGHGTAVGHGVTDADGEVVFSGKGMRLGPIRLDPDPLS